MKAIALIIFIVLYLLSCNENPIEVKENQSPIILSLTVFPSVISPLDSAIVICNAINPDGDTLVYDWITDSRLRIKGANPMWDTRLFNTFENSRIFYPNKELYPFDTV